MLAVMVIAAKNGVFETIVRTKRSRGMVLPFRSAPGSFYSYFTSEAQWARPRA